MQEASCANLHDDTTIVNDINLYKISFTFEPQTNDSSTSINDFTITDPFLAVIPSRYDGTGVSIASIFGVEYDPDGISQATPLVPFNLIPGSKGSEYEWFVAVDGRNNLCEAISESLSNEESIWAFTVTDNDDLSYYGRTTYFDIDGEAYGCWYDKRSNFNIFCNTWKNINKIN